MKAVKIELAGRTRYLCFTVEAMFQIQEQFGGPGELTDTLKDPGRTGFAAACKAAAILSEQGELVRRSLGYDPEPIADADAIAAVMAPSDMVALKLAIPSAISLGYGREVADENDEVDLGLAELNAQKKQGRPGALPEPGAESRPVQAGDAALHPRRGGRPVGAVSPSPREKEKGG